MKSLLVFCCVAAYLGVVAAIPMVFRQPATAEPAGTTACELLPMPKLELCQCEDCECGPICPCGFTKKLKVKE